MESRNDEWKGSCGHYCSISQSFYSLNDIAPGIWIKFEMRLLIKVSIKKCKNNSKNPAWGLLFFILSSEPRPVPQLPSHLPLAVPHQSSALATFIHPFNKHPLSTRRRHVSESTRATVELGGGGRKWDIMMNRFFVFKCVTDAHTAFPWLTECN